MPPWLAVERRLPRSQRAQPLLVEVAPQPRGQLRRERPPSYRAEASIQSARRTSFDVSG